MEERGGLVEGNEGRSGTGEALDKGREEDVKEGQRDLLSDYP